MKVLIVGNGGREHALAWRIRLSPEVREILIAPGNAGTALEPGMRNVPIAAIDIAGLLQLAQAERVDLTVVGPEAPLSLGIVDAFTAAGLRCFGPTQAAAQLESSKAFCKDFLQRHAIPSADYAVFTELAPALAYVRARGAPIVVKADGLAAGKGVVVATFVVLRCRHRDVLIAASDDDVTGLFAVQKFFDDDATAGGPQAATQHVV